MFRSAQSILGNRVRALDGEIGRVNDFYVDDLTWRVKHVVVETGHLFNKRKLLVFPGLLDGADMVHNELPVEFTVEQIKNSPEYDEIKPVSLQKESEIGDYFLWLPAGPILHPTLRPLGAPDDMLQEDAKRAKKNYENPHLRSLRELLGYAVLTEGNEKAGHLGDCVVDDSLWLCRWFVIDAGGMLHREQRLLEIEYINDIDWATQRVAIDLANEAALETLPLLDPDQPLQTNLVEICNKE